MNNILSFNIANPNDVAMQIAAFCKLVVQTLNALFADDQHILTIVIIG